MKKRNPIKKSNKKVTMVFIALSILVFLSLFLFYINFNQQKRNQFALHDKPNNINYMNKGLGITLRYPANWFIDDRYGMILLANYKTDLNKKSINKLGNIIINFYNEEVCDMSLDEQIQLGGCYTEGDWAPTEIIDKQTKILTSGTLLKYAIKHPQSGKQTIFYLQKGDRILKISKSPDNSVFDEEFEEIINSIKFL